MSQQTAMLGIMTPEDFKTRTKATKAVGGLASKFKSRGSGMAGIDLALQAWQRDCNKATVPTPIKVERIKAIALECNRWFAAKSAAGKSTPLSNARQQVVAQVLRSCRPALTYMQNKNATQANAPSWQTKAKRGAVKGLGAGYSHERTDYVARGKQANPFSGSAVEEKTQALGGMSYQQFTQQAQQLEASKEPSRVEYLNREQRLKNIVTILNGRLYQDGEPLDHRDGNLLWCDTYAVDRYGNIFSKRSKWNGVFFNHSSYCAGKEVLCAGTLGCVQGKLVYISNMSGHYRPNTAYMRQLLGILGEEDVDLDDLLVECMDTQKAFRGSTLWTSGNVAQDWPHWQKKGKTDFPKALFNGTQLEVMNPK